MPTTPRHAVAFLVGFWLALVAIHPLGAARVEALDVDGGADGTALLAAHLHAAVNAVRRDRNLLPLERREDLDRVAQAHSADMARRAYMSHDTPEGRNPVDRIRGGGVEGFRLAAENVGLTGQRDPNREILTAWLNSKDHRENLLAPAMNSTGIGISQAPDGTFYYTQLYVSFPHD